MRVVIISYNAFCRRVVLGCAQLRVSPSVRLRVTPTQGVINAALFFYFRTTPMYRYPASVWYPLAWLLAFPGHDTGVGPFLHLFEAYCGVAEIYVN